MVSIKTKINGGDDMLEEHEEDQNNVRKCFEYKKMVMWKRFTYWSKGNYWLWIR